MWLAARHDRTRCCTPSSSCRRRSPSARSTKATPAGGPGNAATAKPSSVPDYDPLTISDEELKKLPPAQRAAGHAAPAAAASATPAAAAPAAKPAPPKEPEKPTEPPFVQHILESIPDSTFQWRHGYAELKVPRLRLLEAAQALKADGFDYLSFVTEVDWQDRLEMIYHLFAYDYRAQPLGAILRCDLPRDGMPEVASLTSVWPGAEFMEREAFEMMGIRFLGHPDLRRILLPDDFVGFPMRRD